MILKKELDNYRHVQDLRKRNSNIESMTWPMLNQEELMHNIARSSNESVFDMISTFNQIKVHPNDEKYAMIINHMNIFKQRTIQQEDKNVVIMQQ